MESLVASCQQVALVTQEVFVLQGVVVVVVEDLHVVSAAVRVVALVSRPVKVSVVVMVRPLALTSWPSSSVEWCRDEGRRQRSSSVVVSSSSLVVPGLRIEQQSVELPLIHLRLVLQSSETHHLTTSWRQKTYRSQVLSRRWFLETASKILAATIQVLPPP